MRHRIVHVKIPRDKHEYQIQIGDGLLTECGRWAAKSVGPNCHRVAVISNRRVFSLYGEFVRTSLRKAGFDTPLCLIGDGERYKNMRTLEETLKCLTENGLSRTDAVLALGGGVVGDVAGFAASIYLRGIAFLQVPTTLLAMIDSSVGGKTGVNSIFGKNLIGSFYQPQGVLIDTSTLETLPSREMTAGYCEAIKQGAVAGRRLFAQTASFLGSRNDGKSLGVTANDQLANLIASHVSFKCSIVRGDEREQDPKPGRKSRRILNFGHTFGHALETVTKYKYLKHGEAVGYGMMFAAELSKKLELLGQNEVELLNDVVHHAGALPAIGNIDPAAVLAAFSRDKKVVNDSLQWVLLKHIGQPIIYPGKEIPRSILKKTIYEIVRK